MRLIESLLSKVLFLSESKETDLGYRYNLLPKKEYSDYRYGWFSKPKGIQVLYGIDDEGTHLETILFRRESKRKWTPEKAEKWLIDHGYDFEDMNGKEVKGNKRKRKKN